jgi:hypothetical protein
VALQNPPIAHGGRWKSADNFKRSTTHFVKSHTTAENNDTAVKVYLREIGRIPLLTPPQEIELAAKIENGNRKARALMSSTLGRRKSFPSAVRSAKGTTPLAFQLQPKKKHPSLKISNSDLILRPT